MESDHVDSVLAEWAVEWPGLDASPQAVIGRVSRLSRFFERDLVRIFKQFELTGGEFDVLATLRRRPQKTLTLTELTTACMLSSAAMTHRIDRLDKAGLVERVRDSVDRRVVFVLLTRRGRSVIEGALVAHMNNEIEMLDALTLTERETLAQLLKKLLIPREADLVRAAPTLSVSIDGRVESDHRLTDQPEPV